MVKKLFIPAEINIIKIKAADIIATSCTSDASLSCPANGLCTLDSCETYCGSDSSCLDD